MRNDYKQAYIIDQLRKYDTPHEDMQGKTYDELKRMLTLRRAMEVDPVKRANYF